MTRIYLLIKCNRKVYKKSRNYIVVEAYLDKHVVEQRVTNLNNDKKKKNWYGFVKFDIVDTEEEDMKESK